MLKICLCKYLNRGFTVNSYFMDMTLFKAGCLLFMPSFIVICLPTKHLGVLENFFECVHVFQIELEFEKNPRTRERTNNKFKLNP